MPPQQPPPDPDQGPTAAFAYQLYALRKSAGFPPYRKMGERASMAHTSLSRAARGERFPTWEATKAFVIACHPDSTPGLIDLWQKRWQDANRLVKEEKIQNAPTVRLSPVETPLTGTPPRGDLSELAARFTAELEDATAMDTDTAPTPSRRHWLGTGIRPHSPDRVITRSGLAGYWATLALLVLTFALVLVSVLVTLLSDGGL